MVLAPMENARTYHCMDGVQSSWLPRCIWPGASTGSFGHRRRLSDMMPFGTNLSGKLLPYVRVRELSCDPFLSCPYTHSKMEFVQRSDLGHDTLLSLYGCRMCPAARCKMRQTELTPRHNLATAPSPRQQRKKGKRQNWGCCTSPSLRHLEWLCGTISPRRKNILSDPCVGTITLLHVEPSPIPARPQFRP